MINRVLCSKRFDLTLGSCGILALINVNIEEVGPRMMSRIDNRCVTPKSLLEHIQFALSRPYLSDRCRELTRALRGGGSLSGGFGSTVGSVGAYVTSGLSTASPKELQTTFNLICTDIFGYAAGGNGVGWNICGTALKSGSNRDFYAAYEFLRASGPMIELVERLMTSQASGGGSDAYYMMYEFPASQLPPGRDNKGNLALTAFEYYFYHFANSPVRRHQLSGGQQGLANNACDFLYPLLFEDYLNSFLPLERANLVKLFTRSTPVPVMSTPPPPPMQITSPMRAKATLFRQDFSNRSLIDGQSKSAAATAANGTAQPPSNNATWQSEVLVKTLVMFWIENYIYDPVTDASKGDYLSLRTSASLPSSELLRVVRMFVKHSHYFSNACQANDVVLPAHFNPDIFLGDAESRRIFLAFSVRTVDFWPLDASFRLVLETWLSYIQPWRYTLPHLTAKNDDAEVPVDALLWTPFVQDNVKFYTVLLGKVLARFFRVDLASSKNAYMLYRVARVYSQENLFGIIQNASLASKSVMRGEMGSDAVDLSGPDFKATVGNLLCACVEAKRSKLEECKAAESVTRAKEEESKGKDAISKVVAMIAAFVKGSAPPVSDNSEVEKALGHLDFVVEKLSGMFGLAEVVASQREAMHDQVDGGKVDTSFEGGSLSPHQRADILMRKVRVEAKYDGNPDTMPVRSDESAFLVRLLLYLSSVINQRFHRDIERLYSDSNSFASQIFRQICSPPIICRKGYLDLSVSSNDESEMDASLCGGLRHQQKQRLPPRLILRTLASYRHLSYLAFFYFVAVILFGKSLTMATVYLTLSLTLALVFKSFITPVDPSVEDLTQNSTTLVLNNH